eukprot:g9703.t2
MEDRLCARMDLEGCPLGVRHIFCLFDGHGGDSVAEFCRAHLVDRIVHRVREAHATRSAAAAAGGPGSSKDPEKNGTVFRSGGRSLRDGGGGEGGGAAAEPALVAACVTEACREVDAKVKGAFFTPAGRYVAPRVDDPLDVTPAQQTKPASASPSPNGDEAVNEEKPGGTARFRGGRAERSAQRPRPFEILEEKESEKEGTTNGGSGIPSAEEAIANAGGGGCGGDAVDEKKGSLGGFSTCGTTSLIVLVSDFHVICCNTGDSRAVLASEGASRPMSSDHKPENRAERQRIEAAGGKVEHNRVEGKLAVSRCIGDHPFKSDPKLPLERQMVVCDPEVMVIKRSDADEFVIMACDGVWDVMANDEACFFLRKSIQEGNRDLGKILEDMEDACLAKQSMDNMSVLVIAFKGAWEEGLHLHKSARYVLEWGCDDVSRWLSINNFGQYQDDFEKHQVDGVGLLSLTEADLHHKLHLKKVGLRKKLWQKLSPLRLGYLAWNKRELAAWLGHVGLEVKNKNCIIVLSSPSLTWRGAGKDMHQTVVKAEVDGRALSTMSKRELRALARQAALTSAYRKRLYAAVGALKDGDAGGEWVALHGKLGARYDGINGNNGGIGGGGGGGGGGGTNSPGDTWLRSPHPRPHRTVSRAARPVCSNSSSGSSSSGESDIERASPKEIVEAGRRHYDHGRHGNGEGVVAAATNRDGGGMEEAPVVVRQGAGLRKGSGMFGLKGARRLSRVLLGQPRSSPDLTGGGGGGSGGGGEIGGKGGNVGNGRRSSDPAQAA